MQIARALYVGACVQQRANGFGVAVASGKMQRAGVVAGIARVRIGTILEQKPHGAGVPAASDDVQSGSAESVRIMQMRKIWIVRDQSPHYTNVAFSTRIEEQGGISGFAVIHFRFECPPTGEAVVAGDGEQRGGKFHLGVSAAEIAQAIACEFLEVLERSALW
jgi:hypothetical protein